MKFVTKNIWTILSFALVMVLAFAGDASAGGGTAGSGGGTGNITGASVMGVAVSKAANLFRSVKVIIFVIGGFGLIALAFFAIFGKVKWTWFAGLAFGLAILAAAGSIVDYATGAGGAGTMKDSFGSAEFQEPIIN